MNKKYILVVAAISLSLLVCGAYFLLKSRKVVYIQNDLVFNEFRGKKDFEHLLMQEQDKKKKVLDSLLVDINILKSKNVGNDPKIMALIRDREGLYMRVKEEFVQSNNESYDKYMEEIWKRLNEYIQEYGKEKGYQYILGAQGSGTIMYAEADGNISKEVIEYVNQRYEGK